MPVTECTLNGKSGHKWGPNGKCFTGRDSRARAAAVGRAISAQGAEKESDELLKAAEHFVSSLSDMELLKVLVPDFEIVPVSKAVEFDTTVKKTNEELQLVYSEVYAPNVPDSQGDFMTVEEIRLMAHDFLARGITDQVDVRHDNDTSYGCHVVESFIARKGDPDFIADSWVVAVHVGDPQLWQAIKKGEINGFSMQANVRVREKILEIDVPDDGLVRGMTGPPSGALEGQPGHTHRFTLRFSQVGDLIGGETDEVAGHSHVIRAATVTEPPRGEPTGHVHRFSFLEALGRGAEVAGQPRSGAEGNDGSF